MFHYGLDSLNWEGTTKNKVVIGLTPQRIAGKRGARQGAARALTTLEGLTKVSEAPNGMETPGR